MKNKYFVNRSYKDKPVGSGQYLLKILKKYNIDLEKPENILVLKWNLIVGDYYANMCKCTGVKDETLFLLAVNQVYASLIRMNQSEIKKKVNSFLPELNIKKLVVRFSPN